jgi:mono/diheme cytochrome c family protein
MSLVALRILSSPGAILLWRDLRDHERPGETMTRTPKTRAGHLPAALTTLAAALALSACGGGEDDALQSPSSSNEGSRSTVASTSASAIAQPANTEGRLLASNCFQCHGTLGLGGFDKIRGDESKELLEFATKAADGDIMAAHAQGYTPEQLRKIIAYLQQ